MNEQILKYCKDNYLKSNINKEYAILIKGKWGCGKTYFVKEKLLKEAYGEKFEKNIIWLSIYGLSNIEQVKQKLYEKCHPVLTNKITKFVLAVAKSTLNCKAGIDVNNDNKVELNFSLEDFVVTDNDKAIKTKKVIIVDDIERSSISACELLGFFSDFILEKGLNVIFIGNIEEIKQNNNGDIKKNSDFDRTKEKIIGHEFEIKPDIDSALDSFISEIKLSSYSSKLKKTIAEVRKVLHMDNMRTLRQSLIQLKEIITILEKGANTKKIDESYLTRLIKVFFIIFFQKCSDNIKKDDINDALYAFFNKNKSFKEYSESSTSASEYDKMLDSMGSHDYTQQKNLPLCNIIASLVFDGLYDEKSIINDYKEKTNIKDNRTSLEKLKSSWWNYSDTEFKSLYDDLKEDFNGKKILNPVELINCLQLELDFSINKLITDGLEKIEQKFLTYIQDNKSKMGIISNIDFSLINIIYHEENKDNNKRKNEIMGKIENLLKENNSLLLENEIKVKILEWLNSDVNQLIRNIYIVNGENKYNNFPILKNLNMKEFFTLLEKKDYETQKYILSAFQERYQIEYRNGKLKKEYYPDIEKIKELCDYYVADVKALALSPENYRKKLFASLYTKLYDWMEEQKSNNQ